MKRWLLHSIKIALAFGILAFLFWRTFENNPEVYAQLKSEAKDWPRLALACVILLACSLVSFFRWYLLVRVLGLSLSLWTAIKLGFIGYFFNFFSLGVVGGDIFKAALLAKTHAKHRTEAVLSVVVDRCVGFYTMLLLASLSILCWGGFFLSFPKQQEPLGWLFVATLSAFFFATLGLCFSQPLWQGWLGQKIARVPKIGTSLGRVHSALGTYFRYKKTLGLALLLTLGSQAATAFAFWLIATGLPGSTPSLPQFLVIVPLSLVAAAVPLPMGGLGALEAMVAYLYQLLAFPPARGLLVALTYRLSTIFVALGGIPFFLKARDGQPQRTNEVIRSGESGAENAE